MLEKLNIQLSKKPRKLNVYELELFVELFNNHINWDQILEIMNLENNDLNILRSIDKHALGINEISKSYLPKVYRVNWLIKRVINQKNIVEKLKKVFLYPLFLWLLSLNLITFLVLYILPTTIDTFNSFSESSNNLSNIMIFIQFLIGFEWGIILISVGFYYKINIKSINRLYMKLFNKYNRNIFVYLLSYFYLFDFLTLLRLDLNIESIMTILKNINSPMYHHISESVLNNLKLGNSIKKSFNYLDTTFLRLLSIEDYERKITDRIESYLNVLVKQIDVSMKKNANIFTTFVYLQIGIMVLVVYSVLLYPLKLLEGMNL